MSSEIEEKEQRSKNFSKNRPVLEGQGHGYALFDGFLYTSESVTPSCPIKLSIRGFEFAGGNCGRRGCRVNLRADRFAV